jgi:hypothetical protein
MNTNNYGTLPACQALVQAGIVMETDCVWFYGSDHEWHITGQWLAAKAPQQVPAPSMVEMWRELPEDMSDGPMKYRKVLSVEGLPLKTVAGYYHCAQVIPWLVKYSSANPTDALIYLRIWLEGRKGEKG